MKLRRLRILATAPVLALLLSNSAHAISAGEIDIHGSVSATASYSDTWAFQGAPAGGSSLTRTDLTLNGVHRFESGLRAGVQLYAYKFAGYRDVTLDWANLDYSFKQWLGVRVGRNKMPIGLYNTSQDLDAIRTFANLPLSFYPRARRAITASCDGLTLYGSLEAGKAGSFEYELYYGRKDNIPGDSPTLRGASGMVDFKGYSFQRPVYGVQLIWNAPLEGLRFAYSYQKAPKAMIKGELAPISAMLPSQLEVPGMVDSLIGTGTWDSSGLFAGTVANITDLQVRTRILSSEYTIGKWTFVVEYQLQDITGGTSNIPAFTLLGQPAASPTSPDYYEYYYGQVNYQATPKLGVGLYYAHDLSNRKTSGASNNPLDYKHDYALAVSYQLTDWMVIKLEGHHMVGLGGLNSEGARNVFNSTSDKSWNFYAFQTVISF